MNIKHFKSVLLILCMLLMYAHNSAFGQESILKLDEIRNLIAGQGDMLPEIMKESKGNDVRTLERIYELNTSALTTVEAYMKMLKMALSFDGEINKASLDILNKWLLFIGRQCEYDIEYLEFALTEISNTNTIEQINISKNNLKNLQSITNLAIKENQEIFGR